MARRGIRGIIASMFVIGSAAVGVGVTAGGAGAGLNGNHENNCKIEKEAPVVTEVVPPMEKPAHCTTIEVTKVVTGTPTPAPPSGTEFSVVVACEPHANDRAAPEIPSSSSASADSMDVQNLPPGFKPPFETTLTFGPEGGTQEVLVADKHASDCTVSEEPPAGCTLTSIDPEKFQVGGENNAGTTNIENGNGKESVIPVTVTNNCNPPTPVQPQAAAAAVVATPRFTG
jgi:hypothetical protein